MRLLPRVYSNQSRDRGKKKIGFVGSGFLLYDSAQAVFISRLLRSRGSEEYFVITNADAALAMDYAKDPSRLKGTFYRLTSGFEFIRGARFGLIRIRDSCNLILRILRFCVQIMRITRGERCKALVAFTGDLAILPAACIASRLTNIPLYAYLLEHFSARELEAVPKFWARLLEPFILRLSKRIIVTSEMHRNDLRDRYGVNSDVIHNAVDLSLYRQDLDDPGGLESSDHDIVYTGSIYAAYFDAVHNLIAAINLLDRPDLKLHVYTWQPSEWLQQHGVSGPVVFHDAKPVSEIARIQQKASVLFLPMAFNSPYPRVVRTAGTSKLGEYLAARRPILVHGPPDCFPAWYVRQHDCGLVIDEADTEKLARAISELLTSGSLRKALSKKSWELAQKDFSVERARHKFGKIIEAQDWLDSDDHWDEEMTRGSAFQD